MQTTLRGAFFRPAETQALVTSLKKNSEVYLQPEPENEYDQYAVKVLHFDGETYHHLGYIDKHDAPLISLQWPEEAEIIPAKLGKPVGNNPLIRSIEVEGF